MFTNTCKCLAGSRNCISGDKATHRCSAKKTEMAQGKTTCVSMKQRDCQGNMGLIPARNIATATPNHMAGSCNNPFQTTSNTPQYPGCPWLAQLARRHRLSSKQHKTQRCPGATK